ncbi:hypothetical protein ABPG74_003106 [Tetrahymena malaccensis]
MSNQPTTIIACGRPGVGKSALGNSLLYDDPQCYYGFESCQDPTKWGVTREIQKRTKYVEKYQTFLQYIDIPGQGDHTLDMNQLAQSLQNELKDDTINAILFLVSVQDDRFTTQELCSIQFIKSFFKQRGKTSQDILWLVITHCDQKKPNYKFIQGKLCNLKKYQLFIPETNVIQYDFNLFTFQPFIERVIKVPKNQGYTLNKNNKSSLNSFYQGCRSARDVNLDKLKDEKNDLEDQKLKKLKQEYEEQLNRQKDLKKQVEKNQMEIQRLQRQTYSREPDCTLI